MKVILFTAHKKNICVTYPTREVFRGMQLGGYWSHFPHGFMDVQIERKIKDGISPEHATRYAKALTFGGVSEAEAWGIIKDHDCARHGFNHDLIDTDELPDAYWWDAWRRSDNGGPVYVDMMKAQVIQWHNIVVAVEEENKKRSRDLYGKKPIRLSKLTWQRAIANARDADELRRVMPDLR